MTHNHTTVSSRPLRARRPGSNTRQVLPILAEGGCWRATVQRCDSESLELSRDGAAMPGRLAASCLLQPMFGDAVACMSLDDGTVWVLAVLQRNSASTQVLRCLGDTRLEVQDGCLKIDAAEIAMASVKFHVHSSSAVLSTDTGEFIGRQLRVISSTVKVVGSVMSTVMDRVQHFSRHYLRTTQGLDRVAAQHIECEAENLLRLKGQHALVEGAKLIKARGAQIHFG